MPTKNVVLDTANILKLDTFLNILTIYAIVVYVRYSSMKHPTIDLFWIPSVTQYIKIIKLKGGLLQLDISTLHQYVCCLIQVQIGSDSSEYADEIPIRLKWAFSKMTRYRSDSYG